MRRFKSFSLWLAACGMVAGVMAASADDGRIAVAVGAAHREAPVSDIAARAPYILIFEAAGALVASHANPAAGNPGGAGPALAGWLAEQRVGTLIAGNFGDKLTAALKEKNIRAVTATGPASRAVNAVPR